MALTPTTQHSIYTLAAEMMAAAATDGDRARIDRALDLVQSVQRMPDRPDLFLVVSATVPDAAYRVHQGQCNCPDASQRDARRCKHAVAVDLFKRLERAETDREQLTVYVAADESILDLWPVWPSGEQPDLPPQCRRCHAEPALRTHRDGLGQRCVSRELFGDDAAA